MQALPANRTKPGASAQHLLHQVCGWLHVYRVQVFSQPAADLRLLFECMRCRHARMPKRQSVKITTPRTISSSLTKCLDYCLPRCRVDARVTIAKTHQRSRNARCPRVMQDSAFAKHFSSCRGRVSRHVVQVKAQQGEDARYPVRHFIRQRNRRTIAEGLWATQALSSPVRPRAGAVCLRPLAARCRPRSPPPR